MPDKIKILFVLYSQAYSGAEINVIRLVKASDAFVDPVILCSEGEFASRLKAEGFSVCTSDGLSSIIRKDKNIFTIVLLAIRKMIALNRGCLSLCADVQPSMIQSSNLLAGFYLVPSILLLKMRGAIKRSIWYNQDIAYEDRIVGAILRHICVLIYDRTCVLSEAARATYAFMRKKIIVLPGGVDIGLIKRHDETIHAIRGRFDGAHTPLIVIGIFGAISERKGHHLLIEAFRRLHATHPNLRLLILGEYKFTSPSYERRIADQLGTLEGGLCRVEPWTDDVWNYYGAVDILVNATTPALSEAFGNTVLEAMAGGTIVVAARTGGIPEIVDDTVNGFLFEAGNVDALTETLGSVVARYDQMEPIRKNGVEKAARVFRMNTIAERYRQHVLGS